MKLQQTTIYMQNLNLDETKKWIFLLTNCSALNNTTPFLHYKYTNNNCCAANF